MRDLTQKEIDNAPGWATHYFIDDGDGSLCYENEYRYVYEKDINQDEAHIYRNRCLEKNSKPIPRKKIDINNHVWTYDAYVAVDDDGCLWFEPGDSQVTGISEKDSVAIAKHFKQIRDDLK